MGQENYLRTGQVASLLSVNARTVRRWIALRQICCFTTPGGARGFPASEVERVLGHSLVTREAH